MAGQWKIGRDLSEVVVVKCFCSTLSPESVRLSFRCQLCSLSPQLATDRINIGRCAWKNGRQFFYGRIKNNVVSNFLGSFVVLFNVFFLFFLFLNLFFLKKKNTIVFIQKCSENKVLYSLVSVWVRNTVKGQFN